MSNYPNTPSMDEILARIKRALEAREKGSQTPVSESAPTAQPLFKAASNVFSIEEAREYAANPDVAKKIFESNFADGNDLNLAPAAPAKKVLKLDASMKVAKSLDLSNIDADKFATIIATAMSRDLGISYLAPKVKEWLGLNLANVAKASKK
ncbi:MAG: hypothetical protein FWD15_03250 [Alphaproteobacteria bacterium]|nr:hypothetical protein [Alphaproteobacteria bacterium]